MLQTENISAKCMQMCPISECVKREKNKSIHILEQDGKTKGKANFNKMVKMFLRSGGSTSLADPELLRPFPVLIQTIEFLLKEIIEDNRVSPLSRYDFINDRLRSVKQDGVIQRLSSKQWLQILPPMIRFYSISAYLYCEERLEHYDQKLNIDQLKDCLLLYITNISEEDYRSDPAVKAEMEALYLIINSEDVEAINRAVLLDLKEATFEDTFKLIRNMRERKYTSVLRLVKKLPLLPACLFVAIHLNKVRKQILQIMSYAYSCKNMSYPLPLLERNLIFNSRDEVIDECAFYEITVLKDADFVKFKKMLLKKETAPSRKLCKFNEEINKKPIPHILFKC